MKENKECCAALDGMEGNDRAENSFVSLQNLEKVYPNGVKAVYNFNLDIARHEFVVLVGPSGCGKTTTLRMLAGLEDITSGSLFVDGEYANFKPSKDRKMAMVFQSYALYPQMTVYENIAYPLRINKYPVQQTENGTAVYRKLTQQEIDEKVFTAAKILDLGPYLDRQPKQLSGGQMQRVALGRAIVKNVPIFLMDEPLSNLDAKLRLVMRSELVKLHNEIGATTVYVTHDQTEAMTMATRMVVMSKGFIQQTGTPKEIYNHPKNIFVARFIGSPAMNLFSARYDGQCGLLLGNMVRVGMDRAFQARHEAFYQRKIREFEAAVNDFTPQAEEYVKKILSALAVDTSERVYPAKKKGIFQKWSKAKAGVQDAVVQEKDIAAEKLAQLRLALSSVHELTVGIRPERLNVRLYRAGMDIENKLTAAATVCELLGADYNVHFNLFGRDTIAKLPASEEVRIGDQLVVEFHSEDMLLFDPITGDAI